MSDGDPIDWLDDETAPATHRSVSLARVLRRRAGLLALLSAGGAVVLALVAADRLAAADLGTSLRARSCDSSPILPLVLFAIAGLLTSLTPRLSLLRNPMTITTWRPGIATTASVVPVGLLAFTLPGTLGCESSRTIARWQLLGDSLTGTAGVALCVASALALGSALAFVMHIGLVIGADRLEQEQPTIVELAIQEAAELERDEELRRFRGVD